MASGSIYVWELEKDGRELNVKVDGSLVLNDVGLMPAAAVFGHGIVHLVEDRVTTHFAESKLVRVLEERCEPFDGYHLYYTSRRQPSAAFSILFEALRSHGQPRNPEIRYRQASRTLTSGSDCSARH